MIRLYSKERARRIIARQDSWIQSLSRRYMLPAACLQAILEMEIAGIDLLDVLADLAVEFYWARYALRRRLQRLGLVRSALPLLRRGVFGKRDSSTGYAQIFAYVGINAVNFALDGRYADAETLGLAALGLGTACCLDPDDPDTLCRVWHALHRNRRFNLELAALNLLAAAEEMTGRVDFAHYSDREMMLVLTRYNAKVKTVTPYGREAYACYLRYSAALSPPAAPESGG